ncbi:MAG: glycoside hydrolase family 88 protein [Thermoguttaceae bacterium]|jgi:unsaturated rhamnogalacturonyl hydrolase|nr:glycoside hydrolase family 88 protein [Thermoguttaceae bacterium]
MTIRPVYALALCLCTLPATVAVSTAAEQVETLALARTVARKGIANISLKNYMGVLLMHGMAELALASGEPDDLEAARKLLLPFATGEDTMGGNFVSYRCGGNGAALLLLKGKLPEGRQRIAETAEEMHRRSPRSSDRIIGMERILSGPRATDGAFIDTAVAVTPFLAWTGLAIGNDDYIEDAWQQIHRLHVVLLDREHGLYHQGRGFQGEGVVSADHWSRGNGWAALSWAALVGHLPEEHPRREEVNKLFREFMAAAVKYQDADGMWRQEMTLHDERSYPETSGTGLLLFAMGVGIERGVLDDSYREPFLRGLRGYLRYIEPDGSVSHTCRGTLCPGDGSIEAYLDRPWVMNDPHAFGPAVLALVQAHRIGIERLTVEGRLETVQ